MRPNSCIFTLYGDFVERAPGDRSLWLGSIIRLVTPFGVTEQAIRQAVSRMGRQGWLAPQRVGRRAYYRVTEHGRRRIEGLSPRIYGPVVEWDGAWRMLTYTIKEGRRDLRERLRKDLSVLGWAPLSSSTWITPTDRLADAREAADSAGLSDEIDTFVARNTGPHGDRELIERCWDLPALTRAYRAFSERYRDAAERADALCEEDAFTERVRLVYDYRKFAYIDPGFPIALLPANWPGAAASGVFRTTYAALQAKSQQFFERARIP